MVQHKEYGLGFWFLFYLLVALYGWAGRKGEGPDWLGAAEQDSWVVVSRRHMGRGEVATCSLGRAKPWCVRGHCPGSEEETTWGGREVTSKPTGHGCCQNWLSLIRWRCFSTRLPAAPGLR